MQTMRRFANLTVRLQWKTETQQKNTGGRVLKSRIWGYILNASGRVLPLARREAAGWERTNLCRQEIRYGFWQRILNAGTDRPIRFATRVFLLSAVLAALFLLPTQAVELVLFFSKVLGGECTDSLAYLLGINFNFDWSPKLDWHLSGVWLPSIQWTFPLLKKDDFDIAAFTGVPWTIQATLIALVYPIVLSFVSVLLQKNSQFGAMMRVYIIESGVMPSGASSIALLIFLGLQYFLTPYFDADSNPLLFTASILTDFIWLTINVLLTGNYLTKTVHFIRESERNSAFQRAIVGVALTRELETTCHRLLYAGAPMGLRNPYETSDSAPIVRIGFAVGGTPGAITHLKQKMELHDVRMSLLMLVAKRWIRRAKPGPNGERPVLAFPLSLYTIYSGKTNLCYIADGPALTWLENLLIKLAFIFHHPKKTAPKLVTHEMLSELASEIRSLLDDNRMDSAKKALQRLTSTHNLLLKSCTTLDSDHLQSTATLGTMPGSFSNDTLSIIWMRIYRDICIQVINLIGEDLTVFAELANADADITLNLPLSPPQPYIDSQLLGTMLANNLGKWWTKKVDETSSPGGPAFDGVLPPLYDKIYDRALRHLIGHWGNITLRIDNDKIPTDEGKWQHHSSRALIYATHIENLASIFLAAVSRRDITASRRLADCFLKWLGTRTYSLQIRNAGSIEPHPPFSIQIANQSWIEARASLSTNDQPIGILSGCRALSTAIQEYWESMRLYLLLQLIHNAGECKKIDMHRLELAAALIHPTGIFEGGKVSAKRLLSFDQALTAILMECFDAEHDKSRINSFADNEGTMRNREMDIQGWTYSWSGVPATIDSMLSAQAIFLLVVSPDRGNGIRESTSFIRFWKDDIDRLQMVERHLKQLLDEISSHDFLARRLTVLWRLRKILQSPQSRKMAIERAKVALAKLIEITRSTWINKIQSLSIDSNLIQHYKTRFSKALFDTENLPAFINRFEFARISGVASVDYGYMENKRYLLEKVGTGVHEDTIDTIAGYMRDKVINQALLRKLENEGITPVGPNSVYADFNPSYEDRIAFVSGLEVQSQHIREQGRTPYIIGGPSMAHTYLSPWAWNDEYSPLPDKFAFSTIQLKAGRVESYCLNGTPVIEFNAESDGYYVVPADMLDTLKVYGSDVSSAVSLSYSEVDPETLSMEFSCVAAF